MDNKLLNNVGCPMCGAAVSDSTRACGVCGSFLLIGVIDNNFNKALDKLKIGDSINKWRSTLESKPDDPVANYCLGLSYLNSGLTDAALIHLRKTVLLSPEVADAHFNLAMCLWDNGNIRVDSVEFDEMVKEIEYALQLDPLFHEAKSFRHIFMGLKYQDIDLVEAIKEYRKAIDVCPDVPVAHNNLGMCYANNDQVQMAETCFLKAIEMANLGISYNNMCWLKLEQKKYDDGVEWGKKALIHMSSDDTDGIAMANSNIALCYNNLSQKDLALVHIKKAVALSPYEPLFKENLEHIESKFNCFVITATMGDHTHPWVIRLQAFRDQILAPSEAGGVLIKFYYVVGPVFARIIANSNFLRILALVFVVVPAILFSKIFSLDVRTK